VPHAVVAVNQGGRVRFLNHPDVRSDVHPAGSDAANVLRQAEDAVAVRAAQVGKDHQPCDLFGIGRGEPDGTKRTRDERLEIAGMESALR